MALSAQQKKLQEEIMQAYNLASVAAQRDKITVAEAELINRRLRIGMRGLVDVREGIEQRFVEELTREMSLVIEDTLDAMFKHGLFEDMAEQAIQMFSSLRKDVNEPVAATQARMKEAVRTDPKIRIKVFTLILEGLSHTDSNFQKAYDALLGSLILYQVAAARLLGKVVNSSIKKKDIMFMQELKQFAFVARKAVGGGYTAEELFIIKFITENPPKELRDMIDARTNKITLANFTQANFDTLQQVLMKEMYERQGGALGARALAKKIKDELAKSGVSATLVPKEKYMLWARTEGAVVQNDALTKLGKDSGMNGKQWVAILDSVTRPEHVMNNAAGVIPETDKFPDGSTDGGSGSMSPWNCRCCVGPALLPRAAGKKDDKEKEKKKRETEVIQTKPSTATTENVRGTLTGIKANITDPRMLSRIDTDASQYAKDVAVKQDKLIDGIYNKGDVRVNNVIDLAHRTKAYDDLSASLGVDQSYVYDILNDWYVGEDSGANVIAVRQAIERVFKTKMSVYERGLADNVKDKLTAVELRTVANLVELKADILSAGYSSVDDFFDQFVTKMHAATQAEFKRMGITEIYATRGVTGAEAELIKAKIARGEVLSTLESNALSSWEFSGGQVAQFFGDVGYEAIISVENILSFSKTGFGRADWFEVVVVGKGDDAVRLIKFKLPAPVAVPTPAQVKAKTLVETVKDAVGKPTSRQIGNFRNVGRFSDRKIDPNDIELVTIAERQDRLFDLIYGKGRDLDEDYNLQVTAEHIKYRDVAVNFLKKKLSYSREVIEETLQEWLGDSNRSAVSMSVQKAVQRVFGSKRSAYQKSLDAGINFNKRSVGTADFYDDIVKAVYETTQEQLKDAGITHVTVFRGVRGSEAETVLKLLEQGHVKATIDSNALSSWEFSGGRSAAAFGEVGYEMTIPIERILSLPTTGFGSAHEFEITILGNASDVVRLIRLG